MIRFLRGNLFHSQAEALVNTVNCVGIMGKGIAYQFKRAFPESSARYVERCKSQEMRLGEIFVSMERERWIVHFPTKQHWKTPSRLSDIEAGLRSLREFLAHRRVKSIAIPPLGCGNGGLEWPDVKSLIIQYLQDVSEVVIEVYEPTVDEGNLSSNVARKPRLSLSAVVVAAVVVRLESARKIALQKALYFFDVYANQKYFEFKRHHFGPWCPDVDRLALLIKDYLDYTGVPRDRVVDQALRQELSGADVEKFHKWLPAIEAATRLVNEEGHIVEALATLHAVLRRAEPHPLDENDVIQQFFAWSDQKSAKFSVEEVRAALRRLEKWRLARFGLLGWESIGPLHMQGAEKRLPTSA